MPNPTDPKPDPKQDPDDAAPPPGVTPNQPKDPGVYGGEWGETGKSKSPTPPPLDRPQPIEAPDKGDAPPPRRTAPPGLS